MRGIFRHFVICLITQFVSNIYNWVHFWMLFHCLVGMAWFSSLWSRALYWWVVSTCLTPPSAFPFETSRSHRSAAMIILILCIAIISSRIFFLRKRIIYFVMYKYHTHCIETGARQILDFSTMSCGSLFCIAT